MRGSYLVLYHHLGSNTVVVTTHDATKIAERRQSLNSLQDKDGWEVHHKTGRAIIKGF
jgi:hypothetical protein